MKYYRIGIPDELVQDIMWNEDFEVEPEPTCRDICEEPSVWEQTRCVFCCSLCGFGFDDYGAHWYYPKVPIEDEIINYCPNCGAKVVSE